MCGFDFVGTGVPFLAALAGAIVGGLISWLFHHREYELQKEALEEQVKASASSRRLQKRAFNEQERMSAMNRELLEEQLSLLNHQRLQHEVAELGQFRKASAELSRSLTQVPRTHRNGKHAQTALDEVIMRTHTLIASIPGDYSGHLKQQLQLVTEVTEHVRFQDPFVRTLFATSLSPCLSAGEPSSVDHELPSFLIHFPSIVNRSSVRLEDHSLNCSDDRSGEPE